MGRGEVTGGYTYWFASEVLVANGSLYKFLFLLLHQKNLLFNGTFHDKPLHKNRLCLSDSKKKDREKKKRKRMRN